MIKRYRNILTNNHSIILFFQALSMYILIIYLRKPLLQELLSLLRIKRTDIFVPKTIHGNNLIIPTLKERQMYFKYYAQAWQ